MKKTLTSFCTAVLVAVSLPVTLSACAGTDSSRSTGAYVDDATITAKVKTALATDDVAKATQVNVETYQGVVQLSGFVESQRVADRSVEVARQVEGVKEVKNSLRVR